MTIERKILLPVNDSLESEWAVEWASKHLVTESDHVTLLNYHSPTIPFSVRIGHDEQKLTDEFKEKESNKEHKALEFLNKYATHFKSKCQLQALAGDVKLDLVEYIKKEKPDLVLFGNRNLKGVKKAVLGSLSEHVLHHVNTPVLILHKNDQ